MLLSLKANGKTVVYDCSRPFILNKDLTSPLYYIVPSVLVALSTYSQGDGGDFQEYIESLTQLNEYRDLRIAFSFGDKVYIYQNGDCSRLAGLPRFYIKQHQIKTETELRDVLESYKSLNITSEVPDLVLIDLHDDVRDIDFSRLKILHQSYHNIYNFYIIFYTTLGCKSYVDSTAIFS